MARLAEATDETGKHLKINFDHGTTTLGFQYKGGIILAVDSRATGGQFIGKFKIYMYIYFQKIRKEILYIFLQVHPA